MYVILANNLSLVAACRLRWLGVDAAWPLRVRNASAPATEAQERVYDILPLHAGVQELWVVADQSWGRRGPLLSKLHKIQKGNYGVLVSKMLMISTLF